MRLTAVFPPCYSCCFDDQTGCKQLDFSVLVYLSPSVVNIALCTRCSWLNQSYHAATPTVAAGQLQPFNLLNQSFRHYLIEPDFSLSVRTYQIILNKYSTLVGFTNYSNSPYCLNATQHPTHLLSATQYLKGLLLMPDTWTPDGPL